MTQEDKALLLKDIYARIPYGVKGCCEGETLNTTPLCWYAEHTLEYSVNYMVIKNGWRPYLFPMSSMTDEQKYEYDELIHSNNIKSIEGVITSTDCSAAEIDWLNDHHFDYRGLISKGLAIDATGLNIY
jgi:hypothetical protein